MERKYNRKVMIAKKPIHSHNRGPNQNSRKYCASNKECSVKKGRSQAKMANLFALKLSPKILEC